MRLGLIDTHALVKLLYTSLVAGVSVAVVFSLAIFGAARSSDMRRAGHRGRASLYGAVGVLATGLSIGIVIFGLVLVAHKS